MKKAILILLLCSILPNLTYGQGETNHWYFGYQAAIRFNADGSTTSLNDNVMNAPEGSATASDAFGNLLFYTDGQTVYDRTHQIMANGTDLITNPTGTQTALIVPKPNDPGILYIFSVDATTNNVRGTGLNYAIVDMTLNNGNGRVTQKNMNLLEDCAEKIAVVIQDCTTNSLWVITQATETGQRVLLPAKPNFNTLHAFEITPAGVSNISVKSTFNTVVIEDDRGYIKVSPDKTKLASANMRDGLLLYDFDVNTGLFSNQQRIHMSGVNYAPYGVEFSPNSQYLYVHSSNNRSAFDGHTSELLQFDVQAADITGSGLLLDTSDIYRGALQLANNGKIYRALSVNFETGIPFLGVINEPNNAGAATNYQHNGLALNSGNSSVGLPLRVPSLFETVDLLPEDVTDQSSLEYNVCEGQPLKLEVQDIIGATYTWTKDNVEFDNPSRNIYYIDEPTSLDEGIYFVTATRPNETCLVASGEVTVAIAEIPVAEDKIIIVCDEDLEDFTDGQTTVNLRSYEENIEFTYSYFLSEDDRNNDNSIAQPEQFNNTIPFEQTIWYEIENEAGCIANGTFEIQVQSKQVIELDETYVLCTDNPELIISAPDGFDAYRWSIIENTESTILSTDQNFIVLDDGTYILEAINLLTVGDNATECISSTTFEVLPSSLPIIDDVIIDGNTIEVRVSGEGDYEFSLDNLTFQDDNNMQVLSAGQIDIYVRDKNGCGLVQETIEQDLTAGRFPKFFTPNGDNANDFWQFIPPIVENEIELEIIHVYDRYGLLMTQIDPKSQGWNGFFNGKLVPATDYWFKAHFSDNSVFVGNFSLKR